MSSYAALVYLKFHWDLISCGVPDTTRSGVFPQKKIEESKSSYVTALLEYLKYKVPHCCMLANE